MNKNIFKSAAPVVPSANTVNAAGGLAYAMSDEHALAQYACTGTFNDTFYASGEDQVANILSLANKVRPEFLAKVAVYAHQSAFMKDSAALLLAVLAGKNTELFKSVFGRVVTNGKMLRNFVQAMRSGVTGRKSLGSAPKKLVEAWLTQRSNDKLFEDSVGNDPSLVDVIKMVHPRPATKEREAFYAYLLGKKYDPEKLPKLVREFEAFKATPKGERVVPNVSFQMLTALDLSDKEWIEIAKTAGWHMTRMNLNTFARHGVFKDSKMVPVIASRLKDEKAIKGSKVFPYQLFAAYHNADAGEVPMPVTNALQDAMETATMNVPHFSGKVVVAVDCSGSMSCPVTGNRKGATSKVTCNQVASLVAACVMRNSDDVSILRFDTNATAISLNPRDSVMTNCAKIGFNGGGTDCGSPLALLNRKCQKADTVIIVSDNESWSNQYGGRGSTNLQTEWETFKRHNPKAKLICIDLAAAGSTQAVSRKDTLNVGGFSDSVFDVISAFIEGTGSPDFWTKRIEAEVTL